MEYINTQLNKDVDKFRKEAAQLGFELRGLDDGNRAYSVLSSSISQCTSEKNGYNGSQLGLQTIKSKGKVTGVVCGHAKKRNKAKSKTLTKAMMTTATQIVDGRDYGDMMDLLAQFCEYAQITSEDLEILATRVA